MKEPGYNTTKGVYKNTFSVASSGTLEQTIAVELQVSNNEFQNNAIKYVIFNDKGQKITSGNIPKKDKITIASNMYLEPTGTAKYTLIIWLDNTNYNQNSEMGKTITGRINVHSTQLRY